MMMVKKLLHHREFNLGVHSKWENEIRYRPSILTFSMPIDWVFANSKAFIQLFRYCAKRLKAIHGYAGYACVISKICRLDNEPIEAYYSRQYWAMDIGSPYSLSTELKTGIKTVNWLTAINYEWLNPLLEQEDFNSELPCNWFIGYDYGTGMVIQAGRLPDTGQVDIDARPASYVLLNRMLRPLRVKKIEAFHTGEHSTQENLLVSEYRADAWLTRFDIEDKEKLDYFGKLIKAPKLTEDYAFLDDRVDRLS